jgi:uncharacterized protein
VDRLFLDANVLFTAAHNPGGKAAFLFESLNQKAWQVLASEYVLEEARRNIAMKYPHCMGMLDEQAGRLILVVQPSPVELPIRLPEKDQPVLLAALAARASHLLTGDLQHFGPHMNRSATTAGLLIQTVADYLAGY